MKILLFGATGEIGSRVCTEALQRGHHVTAVARHPGSLAPQERLRVEAADASDAEAVRRLAADQDALVAAISPRAAGGVETYLNAIRTLLDVQPPSGAERVLIVGGAGSLKVDGDTELLDTPDFPDAYREEAEAGRTARDLARASDANWTVFSPAMVIEPGERTNAFRVGGDRLLTDGRGESRISYEDFAVALIDELETPEHERAQFTVAY